MRAYLNVRDRAWVPASPFMIAAAPRTNRKQEAVTMSREGAMIFANILGLSTTYSVYGKVPKLFRIRHVA